MRGTARHGRPAAARGRATEPVCRSGIKGDGRAAARCGDALQTPPGRIDDRVVARPPAARETRRRSIGDLDRRSAIDRRRLMMPRSGARITDGLSVRREERVAVPGVRPLRCPGSAAPRAHRARARRARRCRSPASARQISDPLAVGRDREIEAALSRERRRRRRRDHEARHAAPAPPRSRAPPAAWNSSEIDAREQQADDERRGERQRAPPEWRRGARRARTRPRARASRRACRRCVCERPSLGRARACGAPRARRVRRQRAPGRRSPRALARAWS